MERRLTTTMGVALMAAQLLPSVVTHAATTPVADYRLTDRDAVGQVQGPETLANEAGARYALARQGSPRYMNVPPDPGSGRALQFRGDSAYLLKGGIAGVTDDFVLEVWCRAENANDPGWHGVVSLGDGARGYNLAQHGGRWEVLVGGVGAVPVGPVVPGQWVHLALVVSGEGNAVWLDGAHVAAPGHAREVAPTFAIGDMGNGKEYFHGDVARVRLSRIRRQGFDPSRDLLVDMSAVEQRQRETLAALQARIRRVLDNVPVTDSLDVPRHDGDWLVQPPAMQSSLQARLNDDASATLVLANGLVTRRFHLGENLVCYSLRREDRGQEFLRSTKPEATLTIGGVPVRVGGMRFPTMASGHKGRGASKFVANYFLDEWLPEMVSDPGSFRIAEIRLSKPQAWLKWTPMSRKGAVSWPPKGVRVSMRYEAPNSRPELSGLEVTVHYEMYDGIPAMGKWLSFAQTGDNTVTLNRTLIEELAFVDDQANRVFVESEYNHFHALPTRWGVDPEFRTDSGPVFTERMSDYRLRYWGHEELEDAAFFRGRAGGGGEWAGEYVSRSLMQVQYPHGPARSLARGQSWHTFRSWLVLHDDMDEERKGLGRRKLYRTIFPWTSESLVYMHCLSHQSDAIRRAVDQCADCGFDMVILTFGSGFDMMSRDPQYIARIKADFAYAHSKGIKTGAYILFCSSRSYGKGENDARPAAYGRSLCLGSAFTDVYFQQIIDFMKTVGQDCIETDGPYHGYRCERTDHPHHVGVDDSWRANWEQQERFYRMCMDDDIYIITPDWYFASGARKVPMGYKEANWTLPRSQQAVVARQNIYDGTWWRTPSMSYHALPLTSVHGGGPDSTMEPLKDHLDAYDRVLAQYFGAGIMACYRGFRLYDTVQTKAVVKGWVDFYRRHQSILDSDIIHVRRPDGRDLDAMLHANPTLPEKGLAFIFNPTGETVAREFSLPLYYTGLTDRARITVNTGFREDGPAALYEIDREYQAKVSVVIPPDSYVWLMITEATR